MGNGQHGRIGALYGVGDVFQEEAGRFGVRRAAGIEVVGKAVESAADGGEGSVGVDQVFEVSAFVIDAGTSLGPGVRDGCGRREAARSEAALPGGLGDLAPFVVAEAGVDAVAARYGEASSVVRDYCVGDGAGRGVGQVGFCADSVVVRPTRHPRAESRRRRPPPGGGVGAARHPWGGLNPG